MSFQFRMALRYLTSRKLRTTLTTLSIVIGVAILFGMNGLLPAITDSFNSISNVGLPQADLTVTTLASGGFGLDTVQTVDQVAGIQAASGIYENLVVLPAALQLPSNDNNPANTLIMTGVDPQTYFQVLSLNIVSGQNLQSGDQQGILVGQSLADKTGIKPGDNLVLPAASGTLTLTVKGVYESKASPGGETIFANRDVVQKMFDQQGRINLIEAKFASGAQAETVRQDVLSKLGPEFQIGVHDASSTFQTAMQAGGIIVNLFGLMALLLGGFIIFNTFRTVVHERQHDIGMLRALGASRRLVTGLVLIESTLQGVLGTAVGLLAGYLMLVGMMAAIGPIAKQYWGGEIVQPRFSAGTFVLPVLMGILITIVGGLQPAIKATHISPLEALRPAEGEEERKNFRRKAISGGVLILLSIAALISGVTALVFVGVVLFVVGLVVAGPVLIPLVTGLLSRLIRLIYPREGRLAEANLTRQPSRSSVTASAMLISFAVVVCMVSLGLTMIQGIRKYMASSLGSDYLIIPQSQVLNNGNVAASPQFAQDIRNTPGISEITTIRLATTKSEGVDLQVMGVDPQTYGDVSGLVFSGPTSDNIFEQLGNGRNFIANGLFTSQLGLKPGDTVTFQTNNGPQPYQLLAIGTDFLNMKIQTAYISQDNLANDFGVTGDVMIMANLAPGADQSTVATQLKGIAASYPAFTVLSSQEWRQQTLAMLNTVMSSLYFLLILLAAPSLLSLVNTLGINVIERTREIGLIRAVGATRRQLQRLITAESLLLSVYGSFFGILAGLWLGYLLWKSLSLVGFVMDYVFPGLGIWLIIFTGVLFGLIGALFPARQAARMKLVDALRYE